MALTCDDNVSKPLQKSTTTNIKTSDVTTYDGPSLGCIPLDSTPSLNEVLDAMAAKICTPVTHTHATSDVTSYDGGYVPSCFTVSGTLNDVIEDLAAQICTVNAAIPTGFNSSEITYDGYSLECAYDTGSTGINGVLEGLDDALCSLYATKADLSFVYQIVDDLLCNDYVEGGLAAVTSAASLTATINSGVGYLSGVRLSVATDPAVVLTATKDNYVDLDSTGAFVVSVVNISDPAPALAGLRLWKFETDALGVVDSTDLRNIYPFCGSDLSNASITEEKIPDNEISSSKLTTLVSAGETILANVTVDTAGRVTAIDSDVTITSIADGDILQWNSTLGKFINVASPGSIPSGVENETVRFDEYGEMVSSSFLINKDTAVGIGTTQTPATLTLLSQADVGVLMEIPSGVSTTPVSGGTLAAQTNYYVVTALDGAGGETLASTEVSEVTDGVGTRTVQITWAPVPGNAGYRVYHGTASGGQDKYYSVAEDVEIYTDDGTGSSTAASPPTAHTALIIKLSSTGDSWFLSDVDYPYYVGFGTAAPTATVHIVGSLTYEDGNEDDGKVLTSDNYGNATWQYPANSLSNIMEGLSAIRSTINPNEEITITAGKLSVGLVLLENFTVSANIADSGADGLDTGVEAVSTWYSSWVIHNPTSNVTSGLLSASMTSPTLPTGYTYAKRIGFVYNDSSGDFVNFEIVDEDYYWLDQTSQIALTDGAPTTGSWTTVTLPTTSIPSTTIKRVTMNLTAVPDGTAIDGTVELFYRPSDSDFSNTNYNLAIGTIDSGAGDNVYASDSNEVNILLNSSKQIDYYLTHSGGGAVTLFFSLKSFRIPSLSITP